MRSLAATDYADYRRTVEQQGIAEHRKFINAQMARARDTSDEAQRSQSLANVIAANGMLLRSMEAGFVTGEPNYKAIREISEGIQNTRAFQSLMADGSGERLAKNGSVDALVRDLQDRDRELSEGGLPTQSAIDVIRNVQAKVRARTAQPRDYAMLAAAHRLSSWRGKSPSPDGRLMDVVQRDVSKQLDGKMLDEETDRIMKDPDFRYVIGHEKPEGLSRNALRFNGVALEEYPRRAAQLRAREKEQNKQEQREATQPSAEHSPDLQ